MLASCSFQRALPYSSDTMSWKQESSYYNWIAKCFKKKDCHDFRVRCRERSCQQRLKYASYCSFAQHLHTKHENVYNHEMKNIFKKDWKFYRLTESNNIQCISCNTVMIEFREDNYLLDHISLEEVYRNDRERMFYENQYWIWKYLDQVDDFSAKCNLCRESVKVCLNIDEMKNHFIKNHRKRWLLLVLRREWWGKSRDKQSWDYQTDHYDWLEKCFTSSTHFGATCKFCNRRLRAINIDKIKKHVKQHTMICKMDKGSIKLAKEVTDMDIWRCFRYTKDENIQCFLCCFVLEWNSLVKDMNTHSQLHSFKNFYQRDNYYHYITKQHFTLKYIRQSDEESAVCTICKEYVQYSFDIPRLKRHAMTHQEDWKRIQEELKRGTAHDQGGPSTSHGK